MKQIQISQGPMKISAFIVLFFLCSCVQTNQKSKDDNSSQGVSFNSNERDFEDEDFNEQGPQENEFNPFSENNHRPSHNRPQRPLLIDEQAQDKLQQNTSVSRLLDLLNGQEHIECALSVNNDHFTIYTQNQSYEMMIDLLLDHLTEVQNHMATMQEHCPRPENTSQLPPPRPSGESIDLQQPPPRETEDNKCEPPADLTDGISHLLARWIKADGQQLYFPCHLKVHESDMMINFGPGQVDLLRTSTACLSYPSEEGIKIQCDDGYETFLPRPPRPENLVL